MYAVLLLLLLPQTHFTHGDNLRRTLDVMGTRWDVRQVLLACCHPDEVQRPTADQVLRMTFCQHKHPTILACQQVRPPQVKETVLWVPARPAKAV